MYTFFLLFTIFLVSVVVGAIVLQRMLAAGRQPAFVAILVFFVVVGGSNYFGYHYPVAWTARWEEVKFFAEGISSTTVIRQEVSGCLLVRFVSVDGHWLSSSVDPKTRITSNGVRVPDNVEL